MQLWNWPNAGVLDIPCRVCLTPKDVDNLHPHRLAAFRTHEVDQDIDGLCDLLLLRRMRVGEVVAVVLKVFADAGIDFIEEAHGAALCSTRLQREPSKKSAGVAGGGPPRGICGGTAEGRLGAPTA